ncbi:MAG: apolipoprotein N-acyltransferase [Candidatus Marinimicrobia bacterium]|nr:apolipoprotein N-acyltransferase [Candidatus Neomarinimicrobiota bacterium]
MINIIFILSAILAGISQQPWGLGFLAWFSLVPAIYFLNNQISIKKNIGYAFLWGFIYHLSFLYWLSSNIGIDSIALKYFTMLLVSSFLALNIIFISAIFFYFKKFFNKSYIIYILPFIVVSIEFLRSFGLYGFTWNSLSYTQTDYLIISQNIEYTGIYGLSFWIVLINVIIYELLHKFSKNKLYFLIFSFLLPWITGFIIKNNYVQPKAYINTKIIQPNISLSEKRTNLNESLLTLINLSTISSNDSIDLIIWPESSISNQFLINDNYNNKVSRDMNTFLENDNINLVAGLEANYTDKRFNSSVLFTGDSIANIYHKKRLVPNVEHTPSFFDKIGYNMGQSNFSIGKKLSMFNVNQISFGSMICIESIFPNPTRLFVNNGAEFIVYIVNDGWYTKAPEPQQHAKRCIYRAIENRRSVIRCANTGISMTVDPYGNITHQLELNKSGVINANITISDRKTFYTKYGNLFSILNLFSLILMGLFIIFKKRIKS